MAESLPEGARVLIVRLSALGDVLFSLETLASLKAERPDVRVDFAIEDRFASLLENHPQIERLLVTPRRRPVGIPAAARALRRHRYDAVLDVHGNLKSAMHVVLARSRCKLGYAAPAARDGAQLVYDRAVDLPDPLPHRAERGLFLLRALGLEGRAAPPVLPQPTAPVAFWRDAPRPRAVLHPGTSAFAEFKRWPVDRHAELAARLVGRGASVAVSHGPGERDLAEAIVERTPAVRRLDGGDLGLVGLGAVFGETDVIVAADTGPLHLAAAAGTRCVALFGPKRVAWYGPRGAGHRVLSHDVPCRPCRRRSCATPQCVLGITVDEVERTLAEMVSDIA